MTRLTSASPQLDAATRPPITSPSKNQRILLDYWFFARVIRDQRRPLCFVFSFLCCRNTRIYSFVRCLVSVTPVAPASWLQYHYFNTFNAKSDCTEFGPPIPSHHLFTFLTATSRPFLLLHAFGDNHYSLQIIQFRTPLDE